MSKANENLKMENVNVEIEKADAQSMNRRLMRFADVFEKAQKAKEVDK